MSYFIVNCHQSNQLTNTTILEALNNWGISSKRISLLGNGVYLNGSRVSLSHHLLDGDSLIIDTNLFDELDYNPEKGELTVLYEDEYLLVVNKPTGLIIYPSSKDGTGTMANLIAYYYEQNNLSYQIRHMHRLDTNTSGCLLYAKDVITAAALSKMFEEKLVKRSYIAICEGYIEPLKDAITDLIGKDRHVNGKMVVTKTGQTAQTNYEVIKKVIVNRKAYTCVKCDLVSGRTHQIRLHLSNRGYPIVGDKLYGANEKKANILLHASNISFIHPITKQPLQVSCSYPDIFNKYIKK